MTAKKEVTPLPPDKAKLEITDVANKGELHVHPGQIIDKGTATGQTRQLIEEKEKEKEKEKDKPEDFAALQSAHEDKKFKGSSVEEIPNQPIKSITDPLAMRAANVSGDKIYDIDPSGDHWLKVLSSDKSQAAPVEYQNSLQQVDDQDSIPETISKTKVRVTFPPINNDVCQRHLLIIIKEWPKKLPENAEPKEYSPCEMFFPPDVSFVELLLSTDHIVHLEVTHLDKDSKKTIVGIADFYTNNDVGLHPLEPSPLGIELQGNVVTTKND